ncbi:aspartate aminotransferase family protein [Wenzhouxiangella sp. XN201]|uniref:aspartate aminotransferase family protein n=1 Tax=Wenzhouxiangella sp. XN201 TaxID=2710755 RepID=UPI0013C9DC64|nr:aspartate aminotransferase family protein [Wenzhouxiangella sp. XN201]NEZ04779.1 aspartate aminotransferase family protein [Wenzhouxiangella sp. XN201]
MQVFEQWESDIRGYCRLYPTVFKSASNARQTDENGKSYIDFFAGAGVLNFGHNNARMKRAMIEFLERDGVAHSLDMYTDVKRDFIAKFVDTVVKPRGWNHKLQFMGPTGTNAVETALKLARKVTGRRSVVAYEHGFHGMTLGSLACTANSYFRNAAGVPLEHVVRQPFGSDEVPLDQALAWVDQLRVLFEDSSSGLEPPAAFVIEPIQAEGGVHVARPEWLKAVQDLARDLGALVIYDDIQAGCGRTGSYFSFDDMGLDPDIITLAKGIGGFGTPLAMNLVKPEYDKYWSPGEHTGTFRGQGLSFVAGVEALNYFDDDELMNAVKENGETMRKRLESIADSRGQGRFSVRGRGMMQALDVGDGELAKQIASTAFENGLLIGACGTGGRVLKLIPPLTIPEADLAEGLDILEQSVASARRAAA